MRAVWRLLPILAVMGFAPYATAGSKSKENSEEPKYNACGCYRNAAGVCLCGKKGKCECPGECEPKGCSEKRMKDQDREVLEETKRVQEAEKKKKKEQEEAAERQRKAEEEAEAAAAAAEAARDAELQAAQGGPDAGEPVNKKAKKDKKGKKDTVDKAKKTDKPEKTETADKAETQADKAEKTDKAEKSDKAKKTDKAKSATP